MHQVAIPRLGTRLYIASPALGGVLVASIGAAPALWCEAAGYLVAALSLALIRRPFQAAAGPSSPPAAVGGRIRSLAADMGAGLRYLRRHQVIWPLTVMATGFAFAGGAILGLLVVYAVQGLGLAEDDARVAWLYSASGIGSLVAAALLARLVRRIGHLRVILLARGIDAVLLFGIVLAPNLTLALVVLCAWHGATALAVTANMTLRQKLAPDHLQGRVGTTARMIALYGQVLGAALGGALAEFVDVRIAILVVGGGALGALAWVGAIGLRGVDQALVAQLILDSDRTEAPSRRSAEEPPPTRP